MAHALSFCDIAAPCNACGAWVYVGTSWRGDTLDLNPDNTLHDCGLPMPEIEVPKARGGRRQKRSYDPKEETLFRIESDLIDFIGDNPGCAQGKILSLVRGESDLIISLLRSLVDAGVVIREGRHNRYNFFLLDEDT